MSYYFKRGNTILEYKTKRELYNDIGYYEISKVGIVHSYKMSVRHYGEVGIAYLKRVCNKIYGINEKIYFKNGRVFFDHTALSIFDDNGVYYSILDFIDLYEEFLNKCYYRKYEKWNGIGEVPYTGKRKPYSIHFRYPRTFNEIRQNEYIKENDEPKARVKRNYLPTVWDDQYKEKKKCWKNYRKQQYKI